MSQKVVCKRCGKCCLLVPCVFAQVKYQIHKGDDRICPALIKDESGYKCSLIATNAEVRDALLDGQCDDPSLAHLKDKVDASGIVHEFFPQADDEEVNYILWNHTGFPEFWNIPEDGWTGTQCLRTQLRKLRAERKAIRV